MEPRNSRGAIAEALGGTATQRGVKLGMVAGCLAIFLLFGASALQRGHSNTVNLATGQIGSLFLAFLPGFLALLIAAVLAYYAGLSIPDAASGEGARDGLIAGSITMLLFWVGQTLFVLVDSLGSPQGLGLADFFRTRLLDALLFFVIGGALGWGGSRAAARRARSILAAPTSSLLSLTPSPADKPVPINQPDPPAQSDTVEDWGEEAADQEAATKGVVQDDEG
jgi:hypothetical protein